MSNITERISLLNEQIREVWQELKGTPHDTKVFAIIETLRAQVNQALLDGERYRKAGEALANAVGKMESKLTQHDDELAARTDYYWESQRDAALEAYRQAVEQKEV